MANFLKEKTCRLQSLNLSWDSIRLKSAFYFAKALHSNNTLTHLDLSNNNLGCEACEIIGSALLTNRSIRTLLLNSNGLTATACICICIGACENNTIEKIELNENPIGIMGTRMLMQCSLILGKRVNLSAKGCNSANVDKKCWYNPSEQLGKYKLYLSKPFDRAVAFHLLSSVASHSTYDINVIEYEDLSAPSAESRKCKLRIHTILDPNREKYLDPDMKETIEGLRFLEQAASNVELARRLFQQSDSDGSGKLDSTELKLVLDGIGLKLNEDVLYDLISIYDVDGEGLLDLEEFLALLLSQRTEARQRIEEILSYPILATEGMNSKYVPPATGILRLKVFERSIKKQSFKTISSRDLQHIFNMARNGLGDFAFAAEAIKNSKIRYQEALCVYASVYKETGDRFQSLLQILPSMVNPLEARNLVMKVCSFNIIEICNVKRAFGNAFKPLCGQFTGYYQLDLSRSLDRLALSKLLERSETACRERQLMLSIFDPR